MANPWKVIFAFVGVFVAGAVFGGFFTARTAEKRWAEQQQQQPATPAVAAVTTSTAPATLATAPARQGNGGNRALPPTMITPVMLQRLSVTLKLTDEQLEKIRPIVARADEDMLWLRRENFRNTNRVLERMHTEIGTLLTPEQRNDLEVWKRTMQEKLQRAEKERRNEALLRKEQNAGANGANSHTAAKGN
jgi:hypothetical protein